MQSYQILNFDGINAAEIIRPPNQAWGRLTSINPNLEDVRLTKSIYTIGRGDGNDIIINDLRLSNVHCILTKDENDLVTLEDVSSNGTYVEDQKVGKRHSKILLPGERIYLLHGSRVPEQEVLGYIFSFVLNETNLLKRDREYELPEFSIQIKQLKYGGSQEAGTDSTMCCQCKGLSNFIVTAVPCFHLFCSTCYSKWMDKMQNCPKCTEEVENILKNSTSIHLGNVYVEDKPLLKNMQFQEIEKPLPHIDQATQCNLSDHCEGYENEQITGVNRSDLETDVSTNENSRNLSELPIEIHQKNLTVENKMMKYYALFNKFTAE